MSLANTMHEHGEQLKIFNHYGEFHSFQSKSTMKVILEKFVDWNLVQLQNLYVFEKWR